MYKKNLLSLSFLLCNLMQGADYDITKVPLNIVVPAYNEEHRIGAMLKSYLAYFSNYNIHFIVVLNGITDNTKVVAEEVQQAHPDKITIVESKKGKGNAIKKGFEVALAGFGGQSFELTDQPAKYIGFVDADGEIAAPEYEKLIRRLLNDTRLDGVIASRYVPDEENKATKSGFTLKQWGKNLFYIPQIRKKLGIDYHDYQCGAKLFKRKVIENITPLLAEGGWSIDLEILYLCHIGHFIIEEVLIKVITMPGSHVQITTDLIKKMLTAASRIKKKHQYTFYVKH